LPKPRATIFTARARQFFAEVNAAKARMLLNGWNDAKNASAFGCR